MRLILLCVMMGYPSWRDAWRYLPRSVLPAVPRKRIVCFHTNLTYPLRALLRIRKSFFDQAWLCIGLGLLMDFEPVSVHKHAKKNLANIQPSMTSRFVNNPYLYTARGGLMVRALDSGAIAPGSSPGRGHCVVFLGKTLHSHSASLHSGV